MILSKNKIKHIASLKTKKFREINKKFIIEGDKIVKDTLIKKKDHILEVIGLPTWLSINSELISSFKGEVFETDINILSKISSLETPPQVIAIAEIKEMAFDIEEIANSISIGLDNIQDPGNLGTIIRTADWFGIKNIFCTEGCADVYNSKVVQASMGSVLNVKIIKTNLIDLHNRLSLSDNYTVYGTFMEGEQIYNVDRINKGLIVFGNESKGISEKYSSIIDKKITIPSLSKDPAHVESLNVASSVAITMAILLAKQ